MVKRRRSSAVAGVESSATEKPSITTSSPITQPLERDDQERDGEDDEKVRQEEEEEEEGGGEGATATAAREEGGGPGEKRKRKRTRTRKKKPAAQEDKEGSAESCVGGQGGGGGGSDSNGGDRAGEDALPSGDTVYVEGIPWTCDETDVRDFFKGCGKISGVRMPRWQDSGRPRGYAHVAFAGASGARAAFKRDGLYLKGRYLSVQAPQEPATEKARRANRTAEQPRGCRTVFVKNLPYDVNEDGVNEALACCGRIASVRLAMWNHTRKLKGFGYVEFATERGAESCVRTQESLSIGGRPVVVDFETGAPKGSFRRQDGAQIKKTSADAGVGKGKAPKFKVHLK